MLLLAAASLLMIYAGWKNEPIVGAGGIIPRFFGLS